MTTLPELAALRSTNAVQAEVIAQLRAVLAPPTTPLRARLWAVADFSVSETTIVDTLARSEVATFDRLYAALYVGRHGSDAPGRSAPDNGTIKVLIHRVRRKLEPSGILIESWYGVGYRMAPECKAKLRAVMEAASC